MQDEFGLTTLSAELGNSLVTQAQEAIRKRLSEQCVAEVETVLQLIEITQRRIEAEDKKLIVYKARLAAIQAGEITVERTPGGMRIVYNAPSLNEEQTVPAGMFHSPRVGG